MSITGFISDCSISELFEFIGQGRKTGRLTVYALPVSAGMPTRCYYIWVERGRIVAAANQLDEQGLISLIAQQQWLPERIIAKLVQWCCPVDKPLGGCFKNQGVLQDEQLQQLFLIQISQQLSALFKLQEGHFKFEQNVSIPRREMTGLNLPLESLCNYSQASLYRLINLVKINAV